MLSYVCMLSNVTFIEKKSEKGMGGDGGVEYFSVQPWSQHVQRLGKLACSIAQAVC